MIYWEILLHLGLNALWVFGIWNALQPGEIMGDLGDALAGSEERNIDPLLPRWATKPLFECPPCMASAHGILWWVIFQPFHALYLPVYIISLSGLLKVVVVLVLNKDSSHDQP